MSKTARRSFSGEFKLKAIERMAVGENIVALARELNIKRPLLYHWQKVFLAGGAEALHGRSDRPTRDLQENSRWRKPMSAVGIPRSFSQEFKLKVIERMDARESVFDLACELKIRPKLLYRWRDTFRSGGAEALRSKGGRPRKAKPLVVPPTRASAKKVAPAQSHRVEGFTDAGRRRTRRYWNSMVKAWIVTESYATSIGEVAEQYDLLKSQVSRWRSEARRAVTAPSGAVSNTWRE